jgi:hypothetical protein
MNLPFFRRFPKGLADPGTLAPAVGDAVTMIRATPPEERSRFAREIWKTRRRAHGTDIGLPF